MMSIKVSIMQRATEVNTHLFSNRVPLRHLIHNTVFIYNLCCIYLYTCYIYFETLIYLNQNIDDPFAL